MTSEMLVTAFSVAIAAYALVSPERKLDLRIRLGLADWTVVVVGVLGVHYLFFAAAGLVPSIDPSNWGFTWDSLAYLVLALTAIFAAVRISTARLRRRGVESFQRLAERQLHGRRYPELAYILERHLPQLVRIYQNRYWAPRVKEGLVPRWHPPFGETRVLRWRKARAVLAQALPGYEKSQVIAGLTLQQILLSDHFVVDLARSHPYLGLKILGTGLPQIYEFQAKWLKALLDDRDSILYFEIEHNQNAGGLGRYEYPSSNRLLHYYFGDVKKADELALWKPVGNYVLDLLDARFRENRSLDRLNQPLGDFYPGGLWRNPECAVLHLFDYMVSEALFQNVKSHMFLNYFIYVVEKIERNLEPVAGVDMNQDWPTPYHYLLYAVTNTLCGWIRHTEFVPADQDNVVLESTAFSLDDANIPKFSIVVLSNVAGTILNSGKVGTRFQVYILDMLLDLVKDLREKDSLQRYAELAVEAIARGGIGTTPVGHGQSLRQLLPRCDIMLRYSVGNDVLGKLDDLSSES